MRHAHESCCFIQKINERIEKIEALHGESIDMHLLLLAPQFPGNDRDLLLMMMLSVLDICVHSLKDTHDQGFCRKRVRHKCQIFTHIITFVYP